MGGSSLFPSGGAARTTDGALLVAWRRGGDREGLGTSAHVALVHDGAVTDGPEMHLSRPAVGVANAVPVVLADDELLVSTVVEGVVASAIGRTGRVLVPAEGTIVSPSRVLALDDTRFVVAWNEQLDGEHARTRIAIASATGDALVRTVFETVEEIVQPIAVTVSGGDIWIARFERRLDALEASILRVAHLDTTLQRIDPDRWLGGWGGFSPRNLSLVALDGRPWLVWVSADTRYGRLHVVHASPLPLEACGRDVGAAAIELPSTWRGELDLVAAASRTSIWLAVASNYPTSEATTYALTLP
ncbi:MAG: hypothetical protein IT379_31260 [Deltaproteobacteria bacterium]|nr:hypothetical protein [Deltaproteobacteria bacterium]